MFNECVGVVRYLILIIGEMRPSNMSSRRQSGVQQPLEYEDMIAERPALTNLKLVFLMACTYGLIVFMYFLS